MTEILALTVFIGAVLAALALDTHKPHGKRVATTSTEPWPKDLARDVALVLVTKAPTDKRASMRRDVYAGRVDSETGFRAWARIAFDESAVDLYATVVRNGRIKRRRQPQTVLVLPPS